MIQSFGFAAPSPKAPLQPFHFDRREVRDNDILISIHYCGVCHSDIHQVRDEWGHGMFPMVPGHEIVGKVEKIGASVKNFKVGDTVGVGCMVDSCKTCEPCGEGLEQYCTQGFTGTYNALERESKSPTYGGYSNSIVVREDFVLKVSEKLDLAKVAPLLCAGITTFSPLRHWKVSQGQKVGVIGLGGLGHMAVKLANSMGAHVVVFTTSPSKQEDAKRLGAHEVVISKDAEAMKAQGGRLDFILDTVSGKHDVNDYLACLKRDGTMVMVGLPEEPPKVEGFNLVMGRRSLAGSLIGGIKETQEMLDYCARLGITSDVEMIPIQKINEAYERMLKGDVKYRFVIDMKSLK
jgi:uncharacterized zinc-type alcohol dehydrogenase-like protein